MDKNFNSLALRLEKKVYGTEKGYIRFQLLKKDILDYCPDFRSKQLSILDAGGGTGRFSRFCAEHSHKVLLCDISSEMLSIAEKENRKRGLEKYIQLKQIDLNTLNHTTGEKFDMIFLHGVAEWMEYPEQAIRHCCDLLKPGGTLSLLIYNKNKYILKRGFNGRLLKKDSINPKKRKLTPTGKMSPFEIKKILEEFSGKILLQSGIRVFNSFLKIIEPLPITREDWLEQEKMYYRTEPFASLGEHSHLIWEKN